MDQLDLNSLSLEPQDNKEDSTSNVALDDEGINVDLNYLCERVYAVAQLKDQPNSDSEQVDRVITELEVQFLKHKEKLLKENKALYWFKLGQLYNVSNTFRKKSVEPLSKAVKLDPSITDIWIELGDSYWHNSETDLAKTCFENALLHERDKVPLRNLSILMRRIVTERHENKLEFILKGIEYAKEAVGLDVKDGLSWAVLGNAYLSAFFGIHQEVQYVKLALSAYKQAEKLPISMLNTELHYNKAFASQYSDKYLEALKSLDKSLEIENNWLPAVKLKADLLKYLNEVHSHNSNKGKMKPRKLQSMQKELLNIQAEPHFVSSGINLVQLNELKEGKNMNVTVMGKILWNLSQEGSFPFTCGFIDTTGSTMVVLVYNMTPGKGFIIGDSLVIPDPAMVATKFEYEKKEYSFKSIRIDNPTQIVVNKRRLPLSYFTPYSLITREKDKM